MGLGSCLYLDFDGNLSILTKLTGHKMNSCCLETVTLFFSAEEKGEWLGLMQGDCVAVAALQEAFSKLKHSMSY